MERPPWHWTHLQPRVRGRVVQVISRHSVLGEAGKVQDQVGYGVLERLRIDVHQALHEGHHREAHDAVLVVEQRQQGAGPLRDVHQGRLHAQDAQHAQRGLLAHHGFARHDQLLDVVHQRCAQLWPADVRHRRQRHALHSVAWRVQVVPHGLKDEWDGLIVAGEQHSRRQVANLLLVRRSRGNEVDRLVVPKVELIAEHVGVHQLPHIPALRDTRAHTVSVARRTAATAPAYLRLSYEDIAFLAVNFNLMLASSFLTRASSNSLL